jgi:hypothetical protein
MCNLTRRENAPGQLEIHFLVQIDSSKAPDRFDPQLRAVTLAQIPGAVQHCVVQA